MNKTKAEILQAKTAREVLEWLQRQPKADAEVGAYFNELSRKELEARVPDSNPDMHYDFPRK